MNNIRKIQEKDCYGCTACASVCPMKAINMKESEKGFQIPILDESLCNNCGLCLKVCPAHTKKLNITNKKSNCFALRHKSDGVRLASTSGGAYTAVIEACEKQSPILYGAAYVDGVVKHIRVSQNDINALRGSKYVQSNLGETFNSVLKDLANGKYVVFCGTPCQCDGLMNLLSMKKISTSNILVIDFICHGTLSPKMFSDYLKYCEKKSGKKLVHSYFRSKHLKGWHSNQQMNVYEDGKKDDISFSSQILVGAFYSDLAFKDSCYTCKFTSENRVSDITLGDFWGIEKHMPQLDDNKGVSFIMANTEKGEKVVKLIHTADVLPVLCEWTEQPHLFHPVHSPDGREEFWRFYQKNGFSKMAVKYLNAGKLKRMLSSLYQGIIKLLKSIL